MDDELLFADEGDGTSQDVQEPWKILIADDEEEVHAVTRMVLDKFSFEDRKLQLLSAYSGHETKMVLQQHPDTAVLLLDVVMEEDTTGLEVVRYIREELENRFVRIVLRTGQPGQAPERQVTMEYDINDYKEKTELTAQKLFTTMTGLLRAYRDLKTIEKSRRGLELITGISASLFKQQHLNSFMKGLLIHITDLLHLGETVSFPTISGLIATRQGPEFVVAVGTAEFQETEGQPLRQVVSHDIFEFLQEAAEHRRNVFSQAMYAGHFTTTSGAEHLLYFHGQYQLTDIDQELLKVLFSNITVAFENLDLNHAIIETQREVIFTLGEIIETRTKKPFNHVKHVAECSYHLAVKVGMSHIDAELLRLASPLHDVGKLGIPDALVNKEGGLTEEEFGIFKQHPFIGYEILKGSKQTIISTAAQMALEHHERWDGQGYPQGLHGDRIHIFARITAIADAFDEQIVAARQQGVVKPEDLRRFFRQERGKHFDPQLVDVLLEHLEAFLAL